MKEMGPAACWECRDDGEPWCHDCDQCNTDGMYNEQGEVRSDYV